MLIIDRHAETSLFTALEQLQHNPLNWRCLHIHTSRSKIGDDHDLNALFEMAYHVLENIEEKQVFLCQDRDIFILAPQITQRHYQQLLMQLDTNPRYAALRDHIDLLELGIHWRQIMIRLQRKIDYILSHHSHEHEQKQRDESEEHERRRNAILKPPASPEEAQEWMRALRDRRHQPEIMVIEDDEFSRRLVRNVLSSRFHLTLLEDAREAIATYVMKAPDILFLDINLPDVSGHELLQKITAFDPDCYIVMLSGNSDPHNIKEAMAHGAKGFVAKPFTRKKLDEYIGRCPHMQRHSNLQ